MTRAGRNEWITIAQAVARSTGRPFAGKIEAMFRRQSSRACRSSREGEG